MDLILPNQNAWNVELLQQFYQDHIVEEILSIPLSSASFEDKIVWTETSDGCYTVKSGYQFIKQKASIKFQS